MQRCLFQIRPDQGGVAQVGTAQIGVLQIGAHQAGVAQIGAAQVGVTQILAAEISARTAGLGGDATGGTAGTLAADGNADQGGGEDKTTGTQQTKTKGRHNRNIERPCQSR